MKLSALCCAVLVTMALRTSAAEQYEPQTADEISNETVAAPSADAATAPSGTPAKVTESAPYTPYPAGLSWVLTPQSFRVRWMDRFYYPPSTYVRRCPYYPRGYYWGANWRFNVVGRGNLLFFGPFRYNPYLTAAKASHHPELRGQRRYAPPPEPVGQAMLLGSAGPQAPALPPTLAENEKPETSQKVEAQVATVRRAPERHLAQQTTSRRTRPPRAENSR
ncbi:MAG TPA: hypothetical protein VNH11_09195 [Pirellulales bacterium]|nr:hypothetical protein [Pirellulales bacterium]